MAYSQIKKQTFATSTQYIIKLYYIAIIFCLHINISKNKIYYLGWLYIDFKMARSMQ